MFDAYQKNKLMKKIENKIFKQFIFGFCLLAIATACNDEEEGPNEELEFTSIAIPDDLRGDDSAGIEVDKAEVEITTKDGRKVVGMVRITMPAGDDERLVRFEVTRNILLAADVDSNFWINSVISGNGRVDSGIGSCLEGCSKIEEPEKNEVRNCKRLCWAVAVLTVVAVVVAILQ